MSDCNLDKYRRFLSMIGGNVIEKENNSITCYEYHSVDRDIIYCSKGCGIIWAGGTEETVSHSLDICPSIKQN